MFSLSFFILDSSLLSLASPHFPLPSVPNSCRSFRLRARCRALTFHTFTAFYLNTGLPSHTMPRARCRQDSLFGLRLSSPFPFSLSVAYNVSLQLGLNKYPSVALLKGRQLWPDLPFPFACVSGQPWPLLCLIFVFMRVPSSCSLARLPPPAISIVAPSFACGSRDNNLRTPPHITPACNLPSGTLPVLRSNTLRCDLH